MKRTLFLSIAMLMVGMATMAQPKPGLYKQTKFTTLDGKEMENPQDLYLLLKNGKTYEIQTYEVEGVERVYVVEKEMKALTVTDEGLSYTWTYDPSGYPGGQNTVKVTNVYTPAKKIMSENMKDFLDLMDRVDKKPGKKNKLLGAWHAPEMTGTNYYKFYDKEVRMTLHLAQVGNAQSMIFTMEEVEYTPDGHTREGGNPCQISWQGKDKHTLSYQYNGHTNTENWHRTTMPAHVVSIFK
jgi:hypothetical protein